MRKFWLALLAFFGTLCIAAAIMIPTYLVPRLKVVPLDLDITSIASTVSADGSTGDRYPAVVFDRCSVSEDKARTFEANLKQQRRSMIIEEVDLPDVQNPVSNSDQATLQSSQTVIIERTRDEAGNENEPTVAAIGDELTCADGLLSSTIDRVSVDRKTSVPNEVISNLQLAPIDTDAGETLEDVSVTLEDRIGFQYKFGFDVQKRDYYYYYLNTRSDNAAKFVEETTINGLKVYHFVSEVPEQDLSELPDAAGEAPIGTILNMPARWWGITGDGVKADDLVEMHRYAKATRHVYVEPNTGTIVDGKEDQHYYFRSPDDTAVPAIADYRIDALKATFKWEDVTVSEQVDRANKYVGLLKWGGTYVPIILGVLGALLLLIWGWLTFRGAKDDEDGNGGTAAAAPAPAPVDDDASEATTVLTDEAPTEVIPTDSLQTETLDTGDPGYPTDNPDDAWRPNDGHSGRHYRPEE